MKIIKLLGAIALCSLSSAAISAELLIKDTLPCSNFISAVKNKDTELAPMLYKEGLEHLTYYGYGVSKTIIEEYGPNLKNPGHITFDIFEITNKALRVMTPKFLLEQCQEYPDLTVEHIARATWVAIQSTIDESPEIGSK